MNLRLTIMPFFVLLAAFGLAGCGTGIGVEGGVANHSSESCISCKMGINTGKWSGAAIVSEWKSSAHALKGGAGCPTCHGTSTNHGGASTCAGCHGGGGPKPIVDADQQGKCNGCHNATKGFGFSIVDGTTRNVAKSHFSNMSASYVSSQNLNQCRKCHNPHALDRMEYLRDWARSGHGRTGAVPWNTRDFKTMNNCNRCHTATGFVKYLQTGDAAPWGSASDPTKEVLGCFACHTDYRYTVRMTGAVTASYTNASESYPNAGLSNLCLNCHVGRESGNSIKNSFANFTSASFINSHYLTAGGTVFGKTGYHFSGRAYDSHLKFDGTANDFIHDRLGREDLGTYAVQKGFSPSEITQFTNAQSFIQAKGLSGAGPCVVCHLTSMMKGRDSSHTFSPFTDYGDSQKALNQVCVYCHPSRGAGSNAKVTWFEGEWDRNFKAGLAVLKGKLSDEGIIFYNDFPYFFTDANGDGTVCTPDKTTLPACGGKTEPVTKWHLPYGVDKAKDLMGIAFNYNLLFHDPGAIAHNRLYVRRLLYDSIDFIDDGLLNYSVGSTIKALSPSADRDYAAVLLIRNLVHNGLSGAARLPDYVNWNPTVGDSNERY